MTDNEKTVLEKLCDELRAELSTAQLNLDMWHTRAEVVLNRLLAAQDENAKLREYAAKAWSLFIRHGAVHKCDLSEVDAVRDGLRGLGVEVPA